MMRVNQSIHQHVNTLLADEFYFNKTEETSPFGNVDGSDAFDAYQVWQIDFPGVSPLVFFKDLRHAWDYLPFDYTTASNDTIAKYLLENPLGIDMLIGQNCALVALSFGQYIIEGHVCSRLVQQTQIAIETALHPMVMMAYQETYQTKRTTYLQLMRDTLKLVPTIA
jgi:uncharacterized protein YfeS